MATVQALHPSFSPTQTVPAGQASVSGFPAVTARGATDSVPRGDVQTRMVFFKAPEDGSVPFNYVEEPPEGEPRRNYGDNEQDVTVHDARGRESEFNLDQHAFAVLKNHPHNKAIDWDNEDTIKEHYYPEVEKLLLDNVDKANRVLIFDHTIRRASPNAHRAPVNRAHIDQTPKSAEMRVDYHLPEEAEKLKQGRYWIINVWRPLNGKVESHPLAFADSSTTPNNDVVGVEHRYPHRTGETAGIKHNPDQKWWYVSGIDNDERILLQCYDSKYQDNRVPHSAFVDPRSTADSKPRESIEVRALVFGDL